MFLELHWTLKSLCTNSASDLSVGQGVVWYFREYRNGFVLKGAVIWQLGRTLAPKQCGNSGLDGGTDKTCHKKVNASAGGPEQ